MRDSEHSELQASIPAYVLGALPEDERVSVRRHLLLCEECLADADAYASATESVALSVAPVEPPSGFEERVLERIRVAGGERQATGQRRAWSPARWGLVAASLVLLLVAAGLGAALVDARRDAAAARAAALALARDEGVELRGDAAATAKLVTNDGELLFVAVGLDELPDDRTYQLWLIQGDRPVSAGTFEPSGGVALATVEPPTGEYDAAVTIEPEGGSPQPTTEPVLVSG